MITGGADGVKLQVFPVFLPVLAEKSSAKKSWPERSDLSTVFISRAPLNLGGDLFVWFFQLKKHGGGEGDRDIRTAWIAHHPGVPTPILFFPTNSRKVSIPTRNLRRSVNGSLCGPATSQSTLGSLATEKFFSA